VIDHERRRRKKITWIGGEGSGTIFVDVAIVCLPVFLQTPCDWFHSISCCVGMKVGLYTASIEKLINQMSKSNERRRRTEKYY
jgi:hypothetical protein